MPDPERLPGNDNEQPVALLERGPKEEELLEVGELSSEEEPAAGEAEPKPPREEVVGLARGDVREAINAHEIDALIEGLDFSEDKYSFIIADSYHGEAKTFARNTEGHGSLEEGRPSYPDRSTPLQQNTWGDPRDEAHYSREPVEKVGVRKTVEDGATALHTERKAVPRKGLLGKLGFKKQVETYESVPIEPKFVFDYEFAAPSHGEDVSKKAGNYAAQNIRLSLEVTKGQAETLSKILAVNPKAARSVLDGFMRATSDTGKWNAELYDEDGQFHDPGERYGQDLRARDVRPNYDAAPELQPEIVGLLADEAEPAATRESNEAA